MKNIVLPSVVVPFLLITTGTISYACITFHWNYEVSSYLIFLFTLVYILIFERLMPFKHEWKTRKTEIWADIRYFVFSAALFDAFGKMLAVSLVIYLQQHFFEVADFWETMPFIAVFIIANIIGEFFPYLYHRISHKGNLKSFASLLLWKIHSIHHLPTSLNWFKTNWIHPINMLLSTLFKMLPLLLLGFSGEIIFLTGVAHIVIAYVSHANIRTSKTFLDYIIITPRIHHFHHSTILDEAKNYGTITPFWDLLLGTYYNRKGEVENVGVVMDEKSTYPDAKDFLGQMRYPLIGSKVCCET